VTSGAQYPGEKEALVLLALTLVPGMGSRRIHQFLAILDGHGYAISRVGHDKAATFYRHVPGAAMYFDGVMEMLAGEKLDEAQRCLDHAARSGLKMVHLLNREYPRRLKAYLENNAPPVLFLRGAGSLFEKDGCAVVGTRSPSKEGVNAARRASERIADAGLTLVSGGAAGVDRAAHDAAVLAGGTTVIFLPQGIKTYALPEPWRKAMDEGRLLLASEYLPDAPWQTYAAISRNALIAAQSLLVCVIEPRKQGGSILTARHAMEQGREVFALPGRVDALSSKGTNQLLKEGAALVENIEEIISGLNLEIKKVERKEVLQTTVLSEEEQVVFNLIRIKGRQTIDELLTDTGMSSTKLFQALLSLTTKNLITELPGKNYTPR